jgi:hypothetical protein
MVGALLPFRSRVRCLDDEDSCRISTQNTAKRHQARSCPQGANSRSAFFPRPEMDVYYLDKCTTQRDIVRALVEEVLDEYLSTDSGIEGWEPDKESAEVFWETGGNLLNYLFRYAPTLKNQAFTEEREWRIISHPVFAQHLNYREGRSLIIPYYLLPLWEDGQKTEIYDIIVGPTPDVERSIKSVRKMIMGRDVIKDRSLKGLDLIKEGWGYTLIKASQVPYQDWYRPKCSEVSVD